VQQRQRQGTVREMRKHLGHANRPIDRSIESNRPSTIYPPTFRRRAPTPAAPAPTTTTTTQLFGTSIVQSSAEYSQLKQLQVLSAVTGKAVSLGDTFSPSGMGSKKSVVAFFTVRFGLGLFLLFCSLPVSYTHLRAHET